MTEREALKLALEALQKIYIAPEHEEYIRVWWPACEQAITAIKEALANDTSQERVDETAKQRHEPCGLECDCTDVCKQVDYKALWQQMCERCDELDKRLSQSEQAPMHYYRADAEGNLERTDIHFAQTESVACECDSPAWCKQYKRCNRTMLGLMPYVSQRTWVGLTDLEIGTIAYNVNPLDGIRQFSRAIEAALRSKNT